MAKFTSLAGKDVRQAFRSLTWRPGSVSDTITFDLNCSNSGATDRIVLDNQTNMPVSEILVIGRDEDGLLSEEPIPDSEELGPGEKIRRRIALAAKWKEGQNAGRS